jgi:hypothetical protein
VSLRLPHARSPIAQSGLGRIACEIIVGVFAAIAPTQILSQGNRAGPGHPVVPNPATLAGTEAEAVYQAIRETLRANYAASSETEAVTYQSWQRFNKAPYRSPDHGERFVNHYGNDKAVGYGRYEKLKPRPTGAIVIKDSFLVTSAGVLKTGPLFVMEKMAPGLVSGAGRWRFWMLRPNGRMVGMTGGVGEKNVRFCATCHKTAGPKRDFLFFVPPEMRVNR